MKRYVVERTNKAEIRPEEQCAKREGCLEKLWNDIQLEGQKYDRKNRVRKRRVVGRISGIKYS